MAYLDVGSNIRPTVIITIIVPKISAWFCSRNSVLNIFGELFDVPMRLLIPMIVLIECICFGDLTPVSIPYCE